MDNRSRLDSTDTESIQYEEEDLISECDSVQNEDSFKKKGLGDLKDKGRSDRGVKLAAKSSLIDEYSREENSRERFHLLSLDAYSRHKKLINDYLVYYGGSRKVFQRDSSKDKTDRDILQENHQFLWEEDDEDEEETLKNSWGKRLAKKYHEKLFKEYCIADLSLYKTNKVAMRWRVEKEVVSGKGQFVCGEKGCDGGEGLRSWEVNFAYVEQGERKNALVKLRLCPDCSYKLNHHHKKKDVTKKGKKRKREFRKDEGDLIKKSKNDIADDEDDEDAKEGNSQDTVQKDGHGDNVWSQERVIEKDKSKEEEFEEYFEDIFL